MRPDLRVVISLVLSGPFGCSEPDILSEVPVDCAALPETPPDVVARIGAGEVVLTESDVPMGMAQAIITIETGGERRWYSPPARGDQPMWSNTDNEGRVYRCVWIEMACSPGAALHVCFWREDGSGVWGPGVYLPKSMVIDVPEREQGTDDTNVWTEGEVFLSSYTDVGSSGHLEGRGGGTMLSYFTQAALDFHLTVEALAFHDYPRL